MQLWLDGKANIEVKPEIGDGRLKATYQGSLVTIWKSEVKDWCDEYFFSCLDLWWRWRTFESLPFSGGWAENPAFVVSVLETMEAAYKQHEAEKYDSR